MLTKPEFEGEVVGHPTRPLRRWPTVDKASEGTDHGAVRRCRGGVSPVNTLVPLMVYIPAIVALAKRRQMDSGIRSRVSLMLPVAAAVAVSWLIILIRWFMVGIPLGPGYPVRVDRSGVVQG